MLQILPTSPIGPTNSGFTSIRKVFDGDLRDTNILKNIFEVNLPCKVPESGLSKNLARGQDAMEVEVELLFYYLSGITPHVHDAAFRWLYVTCRGILAV